MLRHYNLEHLITLYQIACKTSKKQLNSRMVKTVNAVFIAVFSEVQALSVGIACSMLAVVALLLVVKGAGILVLMLGLDARERC